MTIRVRLTWLFTWVVSALLLGFCLVIYFQAVWHRKTEFYQRLDAEAMTSVQLLFGQETISPDLFKLLDKNKMTVLNEEEIIIYDYQNKLVYESGTDYLTVDKTLLDRVRIEKEVRFKNGRREIVGVYFDDAKNHFVVFASAVDKYGFSKVQNLAWVLLFGWLLGTLVVFAVGWIYAQRALLPLKKLIQKVDRITASRLDLRVGVANERDEIGQLAARFNQMLDRLEESFRVQKAFVSNASHELRTPLTAITGQIEVALMDNDPQEWQATLQSVLEDARNLNKLSNGLLTLAGVSMDESAVKMAAVQVDEIFWQVRNELLKARPNYEVQTTMAELPSNSTLTVQGNEPLLRIALLNLMENGCKFSPNHQVRVYITNQNQSLHLRFQNDAPAIAADELPHIFKPFRRGSNAHKIAGHGIGLSLTERIVKLHQGSIEVESGPEQGVIFTITLPQKF